MGKIFSPINIQKKRTWRSNICQNDRTSLWKTTRDEEESLRGMMEKRFGPLLLEDGRQPMKTIIIIIKLDLSAFSSMNKKK